MPNIFQFIQVNPNQIIADTKAQYELLSGYGLSPADVEMIMVQVMAYREQNVLAKMEDAMHQNFVQLANGISLDYRGEEFGVTRIVNEEDDSYRQRILAQNRFAPIGTRAAYISKAKSVIGCADCKLHSKQDDATFPPGMIHVVLIQEVAAGGGTTGAVADGTLILAVNSALSDTQQNIIGDRFTFVLAIPVPVDGTVVVKRVIGSNAVTVQNDVIAAIEGYFNEISLSFDSLFDENELYRRIIAVANVFGIQTNSWGVVPVLQWKEFYTQGTVNVSVI